MPLHIIGLGLGDETDITVKGAALIRAADIVFLEAYTSILGISTEKLEQAYGKAIRLAHRETVESEAASIIEPAKTLNVAFLVVGDPFGYVKFKLAYWMRLIFWRSTGPPHIPISLFEHRTQA
jgi:diphthine synthase